MRHELLTSLLTVAAAAQGPDDAVVAIRFDQPVRTELWTVDVVTGATSRLPPFPSAGFAPLAIARDPVDNSILVAQARGPMTRVLRLRYDRRAFVDEAVMADFSGRASHLVAATRGLAATCDLAGGGTTGRDRYTATNWSIGPAWMAAAHLPTPDAARLRVLRNHPRGAQFSTFEVDLIGHAIVPGSELALPRDGNGIVELTAQPLDLLLSHPDGTLSRLEPAASPVPQPLNLSLWIGRDGIFALARQADGRILGLGNGSFPFLYELDLASSPGSVVVRVLSPALPGFPVDVAPAVGDAAAAWSFAGPCALADWRVEPIGLPTLGNAGFGFRVPDATGNPLVFWSMALEPQVLALPLPNGCAATVLPGTLAVGVVDRGFADWSLPIPARPELGGASVFVQALQATPLPFLTSDAVVFRIGR